jgi:uncharacterized protein (DUF58 family)
VIGDDIRNIDWRVTARMGAPHLKLFKADHERHRMILVDRNGSMQFGTRNTFKSVQAAKAAALLGWQGINACDRVSAALFGDVKGGVQFFSPHRTEKSFSAVLKALCQPSSENHPISISAAVAKMAHVAHTGSLVFLISDFMGLNKDLIQDPALRLLNKKCELVLISINDPADQSLYPLGLIQCSLGKDKVIVNTSNSKGREAYAAQWKENRELLYALTSALKVPLIELTTESDIIQALHRRHKR